jgi:hypothetical protein
MDPHVEGERESYPRDGPEQSLPHADLVGFAMKDPEVEGENDQNE